MKELFGEDKEWFKSLSTYLEERAEWTVRDYAEEDDPEIAGLFEEVFHKTLNPDEWQWKYFKNPCGPSLVQVATDRESGKVVAHQACIQKTLEINDRSVKLFMIVDSAIHPTFQRAGLHAHLILKLSEQAIEERGIMMGLPNEKAYASLVKLQAVKIMTMSPWVRVLKSGGHFKKYDKSGLVSCLLKAAGYIRSMKPFAKKGLSVKSVPDFGDEVNALWRNVSPFFCVRVRRDKEYLNWRYSRNPQQAYTIFAVTENGLWRGYAVLAMQEQDGCRIGVIADMVFDPALPQAGRLLLKEAYRYCREKKAVAITGLFSCPDFYGRVLSDEGFFKIPEKFLSRHFHVLADSETLGPALDDSHEALVRDGRNWFFSIGDTDLV